MAFCRPLLHGSLFTTSSKWSRGPNHCGAMSQWQPPQQPSNPDVRGSEEHHGSSAISRSRMLGTLGRYRPPPFQPRPRCFHTGAQDTPHCPVLTIRRPHPYSQTPNTSPLIGGYETIHRLTPISHSCSNYLLHGQRAQSSASVHAVIQPQLQIEEPGRAVHSGLRSERQIMPFVGTNPSAQRKRGWEDDWDVEAEQGLYSPCDTQPNSYFLSHQEYPVRRLQPLVKRARTRGSEPQTASSPRTTKKNAAQLPRQDTLVPSAESKQHNTRTASLQPCHICHRRPTKKSDLDSFAQCQGCREQTCFVCIRECMGWHTDDGSMLNEQEVLSRSFHMEDAEDLQEETARNAQAPPRDLMGVKGWDAGGHRGVVCSRCCIERGIDGEIVCLGCFSRSEGP